MHDDKLLDIFICAHKDFLTYPKSPVYKVIHGNEKLSVPLKQYTETRTDLSDMEFSLAEGSRIYWLLNNYTPKKYIGICHYRKYFNFFDNIPDIDTIFNKHDIITTEPITDFNVIHQYSCAHRMKDLLDIIDISINLGFYKKEDMLRCLNDRKLYACNMFIMKREDFFNYGNCVFGILKEFCKIRLWNCDDDIKKFVESHCDEYLKTIYPGNTIEYQQRVLGFLLERLTSLYISLNFKNPYTEKILVTEEKYNVKNKKIYEK